MTLPRLGGSTDRESGASFPRARCVREAWYKRTTKRPWYRSYRFVPVAPLAREDNQGGAVKGDEI